VITRLLKSGYTVYAPPNPLRGLASDAATIATFVKSIAGPVILVGHSYGGAVISVAARSDSNVKALVYVDAFAPDEGESQLSLLSSYPPPPKDFFTAIPFTSGRDPDVYLAQKYYGPVFASDVPTATASDHGGGAVPADQQRAQREGSSRRRLEDASLLVRRRRRGHGHSAALANDVG
jgi:pimeloyl-ACP methyl ester carboxylesterase